MFCSFAELEQKENRVVYSRSRFGVVYRQMLEIANSHIICTLLATNRLMGKPPETTHFARC